MEERLKTRSDVSFVLIFFIALSLVGVFGGGLVVNDYARARASVAWPVYDGVVLSRRADGGKLRYVYSADGRSYEGTRLKFFTSWSAPLKTGAYEPGETIDVYVDPEDHSFAVLHPGGAGALFLTASLVCGACVFFGAGGVVWTLTLSAAAEREWNGEPIY